MSAFFLTDWFQKVMGFLTANTGRRTILCFTERNSASNSNQARVMVTNEIPSILDVNYFAKSKRMKKGRA